MEKDIWVAHNRKYFRMDDGTVMHRPLTVEEKIKNNPKDDVDAFNLFIGMEQTFNKNALGIISQFKKK